MGDEQWAPEPWSESFKPRPHAKDIEDIVILDANGDVLWTPENLGKVTASVRRIIACVNACAGVPTGRLRAIAAYGKGQYNEKMIQRATIDFASKESSND